MKQMDRVTGFLVSQGCIPEEDKELYGYGLTVAALVGVNIGISIMAGLLLHALPYVLGFLLFFIPLRSFAGGYHMESPLACAGISQVLVIGSALIARWAGRFPHIAVVMFVAGLVFCGYQVYQKAPAASGNNPISEGERSLYRKKTITVACVEVLIAAMGLLLQFTGVAVVIACVFFVQGTLLLFTGMKKI